MFVPKSGLLISSCEFLFMLESAAGTAALSQNKGSQYRSKPIAANTNYRKRSYQPTD